MTRARMQRGFSLIELMIAITLGLLLLLVLTRLMVQQNSARAEIEKSGRQIENGRYAMSLLQEDIQLAGYYGQNAGPVAVPAALPNPCELGLTTASRTSISEALAMPIQGYDNLTTLPTALAGCLDVSNHVSGTDVLVVRRVAADTPTALGSTTTNRVYLQATPASMILGVGGSSAAATFTLKKKDNATAAELRRYVERIYFVSPCNVPASGTVCSSTADGGRPIPTLKRLELVDGAFTITPLVEGIDNLQLDYGIDRNGDGAPDASATEGSFETSPSLAEFTNVVAVRINLLARAIESTGGHTDDRSYQLGATTVAGPGDAYKRQAYSVAVRVINVSGRRE